MRLWKNHLFDTRDEDARPFVSSRPVPPVRQARNAAVEAR
jgi:hypothetical protein